MRVLRPTTWAGGLDKIMATRTLTRLLADAELEDALRESARGNF